MDEVLVYFPYGVWTAVTVMLPALIVLDAGGTAFHVGLLAAIRTACSLVGGFFWPRYLKVANRASVVVMGYLGLFLGLFMMGNSGLLFLGTVVASFFPIAIFYVAMSEIKHRESRLGSQLGRFYRFTSLATALGYLLGAVATWLLPPTTVAVVLAFVSLASVPLVAGSLGEESLHRLINGGIREFSRMGARVREKEFGQGGVGFGLRQVPFLLTSALFSICFGMVFSQRATVIEAWLGHGHLVYVFLLLDICVSALVYGVAGQTEQKGLLIGHLLLMLDLACILLALKTTSLPFLILFFVFSGAFWPFINMFYHSYGLGLSEELLGANMSTRNGFYMVGSLLGGWLAESWGFPRTFALGALMALLAPLPFLAAGRSNKALNPERA